MRSTLKRITSLFLTLAVALTATLQLGITAAAKDSGKAARTILMYFSGAHAETKYASYCSSFLNKVSDCEIPDDVNIIVLTGGAEAWNDVLRLDGADDVRNDCNQVWKMTGAHNGKSGALVPIEPDGIKGAEALPMNDPAMLKAFLDYGAENYPAQKYDAVFMGHGSGPTVGWCIDEIRKREDDQFVMSNDEICGAIRDSKIDKLELLTFYACLMGSAEEAAAFSPYTENIVFSSENLNLRGLIFDGMMGLLCKDPLTDGYTLGKQIVDDTVKFYVDNSVLFGTDCTLTALNTENFRKRLVPKLKELSEILVSSVTVPDKDGNYHFYDELSSSTRAVEFGDGIYQLRDLGDLVSELSINYTEYTGSEDKEAIKNARNEYTDVCVDILNILSDKNVLYHKSTDSKAKTTPQTYRRNSSGELYDSGEHFYRTTGLSVYFDRADSWSAGLYTEQIDGMLGLAEIDKTSKEFLSKYRDASMLYSIIGSAGRAVFQLKKSGDTDITLDDIMKYWEDNGLWVKDNSDLGIRNSGIIDVYEALKKAGYDIDGILAATVKQQYNDVINADSFTIYREETAGKPGEYGSLKIVSDNPLKGQANSVNVRLRIKSDYNNYNGNEYTLNFLKSHNLSYDDKIETGSQSSDDIMRAAFGTNNAADYYKALSEESSSFEINVPDDKYYTLRDSSGNKYLVQILRSDSFVPKMQVPVKMIFPDGEYGLGQIEFVLDENGIGHAVNYIPGMQKREYTVGLIPISDKVFDGAVINLNLNAESVSGMGNSFDYQISSDIKLTNDETRGLTLEKTPLNEIDGVLGYDYEYYIKDIYGNETVLSVNDDIPVLRNIANAKITDEGVKYGGKTLREGKDYEKYDIDGGTVYFGIGSYTGHRMIQDEPSYKEKQINVYRESIDENETVGVRFYENTPNVPYVGIKQFYDTFMLGGMKTERTGDFTYTLTSDGGQTAALDVEKGVLTVKDFERFVTLPKLISGSGNTLSYGLAPYMQFSHEDILREKKPVRLDIGKYGIDIYGNDDDVYFPLTTLSDIFENGKNFRVEYNGKNIYVVDGSNIIYPAFAKNSDPDYLTPLKTADKRPSDLVEYAYKELCFNIDNFYGFPGSAPLNDLVKELGLDGALEAREKTIKELLLSRDMKEYLVGLRLLFSGTLDDKGHTDFADWIDLSLSDDEFSKDVTELAEIYPVETTEAAEERTDAFRTLNAIKDIIYGGENYIVSGNTAMFTFSSFIADMQGWEKYYTDGTAPSERDTYLAFRNALEKAQNDPDVKNFVIDLSTNGGGEFYSAMAIMSLLTGKSYIRSENTLTGAVTNVYYNVDRNLDGRFDEKDSEVKYDMNFAVLTSKATFSSANLLASMLHENGIPVIGEQSSGGSCSVMSKPTPDGWEYTHSSYTRLADAELNNIDGGVPVDIPIIKTNEDGTKDYSGMYDAALLSAGINGYYGITEEENPATGTENTALIFVPITGLIAAAAMLMKKRRPRSIIPY